MLRRPAYARLRIGSLAGAAPVVRALAAGEVSRVPYAEPTWLADGYSSPYYSAGHRRFQAAVRAFVMKVVYPDAQRCEEGGQRIAQEVVDKMGCVLRGCC